MGKKNKRFKVEPVDDVTLNAELKKKKQKKEKQEAVGDPYNEVENVPVKTEVEDDVALNRELKKQKKEKQAVGDPCNEVKNVRVKIEVEDDRALNTELKKKKQKKEKQEAVGDPYNEVENERVKTEVQDDDALNTELKRKKKQKKENHQAVGDSYNEVKNGPDSAVANTSNGPGSESDNASKGGVKKKKRKTHEKEKELADENVKDHVLEHASNGGGKKKKKRQEKEKEVADENAKNVENGLSGTGDIVREGFEAATDTKTIAVSGLPFDIKEKKVFNHFRDFGFITQISMSTLAEGEKTSGLAFVEFEKEDAAKRAVGLDGTKFGSRSLKVELSRVRPKKKGPPAKISGCKSAYIGNLPRVAKEDDIRQFFKDSKIESVDLALYKIGKRRCRGFGHVFFADDESLENAIKKDNMILYDRPVKVAYPVQKYTAPSKKKKKVQGAQETAEP